MLEIDLKLETEDIVHPIRGVGGTEFVFTKQLDTLSLANLQVNDFEIEVGAMADGFAIAGFSHSEIVLLYLARSPKAL